MVRRRFTAIPPLRSNYLDSCTGNPGALIRIPREGDSQLRLKDSAPGSHDARAEWVSTGRTWSVRYAGDGVKPIVDTEEAT